jgi:hypothetical protein
MPLVPSGFGSGSAAAGWDGGSFTTNALAPDGTAAAPGYGFSSGVGMGIYAVNPTNVNGTLNLSVHSTRVFSITSRALQAQTNGVEIQQVNGTAALPSYNFGGSIGRDSGMYGIAEDRIGFSAGGIAQMEINTSGVSLSMTTAASASGMTTRQLRLVFGASGISLVYSSGKTEYVVGQSSQSGAQA